MLLFLAELRLAGNQPLESWQDQADVICRDLGAALVDAMRGMREAVGDMERVRAFFLDAETAVLRGDVTSLDRLQIACRLCRAALPADDDARLLHLRSTHRKEWRALFR